MVKLNTTTAAMVEKARSQIDEVDVEDAVNQLNDDSIVWVDLRDIRERQRSGFIPGSFHAPRGMIEFWIDPESPYFKEIFNQDKKFVFYCASGWRSALTVATLKEMGFEAAHLKSGFTGWEKQNGEIKKVPEK